MRAESASCRIYFLKSNFVALILFGYGQTVVCVWRTDLLFGYYISRFWYFFAVYSACSRIDFLTVCDCDIVKWLFLWRICARLGLGGMIFDWDIGMSEFGACFNVQYIGVCWIFCLLQLCSKNVISWVEVECKFQVFLSLWVRICLRDVWCQCHGCLWLVSVCHYITICWLLAMVVCQGVTVYWVALLVSISECVDFLSMYFRASVFDVWCWCDAHSYCMPMVLTHIVAVRQILLSKFFLLQERGLYLALNSRLVCPPICPSVSLTACFSISLCFSCYLT